LTRRKIKITNNERDKALDEVEEKESVMTTEEIELRDNINKELAHKGFHLRIAMLHVIANEAVFDYVAPIHNWAQELAEVDSIIVRLIKEWQSNLFR
jgi:hypothetical protein